MAPEEAAFFRSDKMFAAGKRVALSRKMRSLRKTRGMLPGVVCAIFLGSIERGGIHRCTSKGGRCDTCDTGSSLLLASLGLRRGWGRKIIRLDRSGLRFPIYRGKGQGFTLMVGARPPPYRRRAFHVRPHKWCYQHCPRLVWVRRGAL